MTSLHVNTVLQVDSLRFGYPGQAAMFAGWSTRIPAGITLVRGGESTGKTTLLRLLAGDLAAQAGEIRINGITLGAQPAAYRQLVFWNNPRTEAFDQITVLDYLASLHTRYPAFDPQSVPALLQGLSLTEHQHKPLYMLSTGSKRKVWLTAAFASGAALTLLDDPFAALDKVSIGLVLQLLEEETAKQGAARAWMLADYEAPCRLPLAKTIDLGD